MWVPSTNPGHHVCGSPALIPGFITSGGIENPIGIEQVVVSTLSRACNVHVSRIAIRT